MLPNELQILPRLREHFVTQFALMDDVLHTAISMTSDQTLRGTPPQDLTYHQLHTILSLYTKGCKTFRAIMVCCEHGLGQDAQALGRVLFETMIAAHFIFDDDGERHTLMFIAYQHLQRERQFAAYERNPALQDFVPQAIRDRYRTHLEALAVTLGTDVIVRIRSSGFTGQNLAEYSARNGFAIAYDFLYRQESENIHCADILQHLSFTENDER